MRYRSMIFALAGSALAAAPAPVDANPPSVSADHLAIHVASLDASTRFYADILGLEQMSGKIPPNIVWLKVENFELHLVGGRTQPVQSPRQVHLAFRVPDLGAVTAKLDAKGVAWGDFAGKAAVRGERDDGVLQIYFSDPDGYWIEVNQLPR